MAKKETTATDVKTPETQFTPLSQFKRKDGGNRFDKDKQSKQERVKIKQQRYPFHFVDINTLLVNNQLFKRMFIFIVIEYAKKHNLIDDEKCFVNVHVTKIGITCKGITREYLMSEDWVVSCISAAVNAAVTVINVYIRDFVVTEKVPNVFGTENCTTTDEFDTYTQTAVDHHLEKRNIDFIESTR